ncbi:glutathione S-transferase family protein [uncultured Enterovirga sp.]|uniref:glutathione S-transferase family protein n=1 Tax=uncultured Enterovirga sp. TaxID=2026352 RepID=UPI0035CBC29F
MKLYGSLTSPFVRKVRVCLKEAAIPCEMVVADPWQDGDDVLSRNPLGKVPILVPDGGEPLFESLLIVEYLDTLGAALRLIPAQGDERISVLRWHALAQGMIDATVARLLETRRPPDLQMADRMAREERRIARALDDIEARHGSGDWLVGGGPTLADITLGVAISYMDFRYPHDWRSTHPGLAERVARLATRPSFVETAPPGT